MMNARGNVSSIGYVFEFVGILGAALLLIAWIPETLRTIRTKKTGMEPEFLYIYFFGSFFLTIYALYLSELLFSVLNAAATLSDLINIYYYHKYESKSRKRRDGNRKRQ